MLVHNRLLSRSRGPLHVLVTAILMATPLLTLSSAWHYANLPAAPPLQSGLLTDPRETHLLFEPNLGQSIPSVKFTAATPSGRIFFTPDEVGLLAQAQAGVSKTDSQSTTPYSPIHITFLGANPTLTMQSGQRTPTHVNYILGSDPAKWHTNLPTYDSIIYHALYPGVDLIYQGTASRLKGTYTIAPHADPSLIRWRYAGATQVQLDSKGNLRISLEEGQLTNGDGNKSEIRNLQSIIVEEAPVAWQEIEGIHVPIVVSYRFLPEGAIGFTVGEYDPALPLVIDPTLVYKTAFGGSSNDLNRAIAVDAQGNAYVAGVTASLDFPVVNPFQGSNAGSNDGYIAKLSADGTTILYATYLGGTSFDVIYGIALDGAGNIYVAGLTGSSDFPTRNPIQPQNAGGGDAFVAKLNPSGSNLVYSTYLGGPQTEGITEHATGIAVDGVGNAYVTGVTASTDFPTRNAIQPAFGGGEEDFFITKVNPAGTEYVYSTYLGGGGTFINFEIAEGIATDGSGNAYVVGTVASQDFPVQNAIQPAYGGGESDAVVVKLNPTGSFVYSTYLGGVDFQGDSGHAIAADAEGNAYVTGEVSCQDFPVHNAFQPTLKGSYDPFVTVYNSTGSAYIYSTYFGGDSVDFSPAIAFFGNSVYIAGSTASSDFPIFNPLPPDPDGSGPTYLARLPLDGSPPIFSTFLPNIPGHTETEVHGLAIDGEGAAYVSGYAFRGSEAQTFVIKVADEGGPSATPTVTQATQIPTSTATATRTPASSPTRTATSAPPTSTATMQSVSPTTTPTIEATSQATATATTCAFQFEDVPPDHTFYSFVRCLACRGIISGYDDGTFRPGNAITRAQIAKMASNAAGFDEDPRPQVYEDVTEGSPFYAWINRLSNRGHMGGYQCGIVPEEPCVEPDNRPYFRPFANATRGQLSKIVANAGNVGGTPTGLFYTDVPEDHPFYLWVTRLTEQGVMSGYDCGGEGEPCDDENRPYFRPFNNVTRGQASKIVANTFYVKMCKQADLTHQKATGAKNNLIGYRFLQGIMGPITRGG
jgi:hypothetical protein